MSLGNNFDFAVGFSRQPLPIGNRFAIYPKPSGTRIRATDATDGYRLELAKLRPETLEPYSAKHLPTATFSTSERASTGFEKITNGVKQKLPGARLFGVGSFP